jgi:hypothetical protein
MKTNLFAQSCRLFACLMLVVAPVRAADSSSQAPKPITNGVLRVHPSNHRYFTDDLGKAVYLTGSHTWASLQDMGPSNPPPKFDFTAYLDLLERHHHNFIRLWRWEFPQWTERDKQQTVFCAPQPWQRTGPALALDRQPRFDLERFDDAYFHRLESASKQRPKGASTFRSCCLRAGVCGCT